MAEFPVKQFTGGITDNFDDAGPEYAQRLDNFVLNATGQPTQRGSARVWLGAPRISSNQRLSDLFIFPNNFSGVDFTRRHSVYAYSAMQIWYGKFATNDYRVSASFGPTEWDQVLSIAGDGTRPAEAADINTRAFFQRKSLTYVSFWNTLVYGSGPIQHPKAKILLADPERKPAVALNLGLPKPTGTATATHGSGSVSYLYYFVLKYTFTDNGITYVMQSTPAGPFQFLLSAPVGGGDSVSFTAMPSFAGAGDYASIAQCYPDISDVNFVKEIYRTKANESVARLVDEVGVNDAVYFDSTGDSILGQVLYTADGSFPYDEPPTSTLFHIVGDFAYWGGFSFPSASGNSTVPGGYSPTSIYQSIPGVYFGAPASFEIRLPDAPTAISSTDIYPVVFCLTSCWRLEGSIDSFGNGVPVLRAISETVGCIVPSGVVKTDRGIYFPAIDGFYFTDGFSLKKVTPHLNNFYANLYNGIRDGLYGAFAGQMSAAIQPKTGRVFWSLRPGSSYSPTAGVGPVNDMMLVADPRFLNTQTGLACSTLSGQIDPLLSTNFRPQGIATIEDAMVYGDHRGYAMLFTPEPELNTAGNTNDDLIDTTKAIAAFESVPVVADYISACLDYGQAGWTKISTAITVMVNIVFAQSRIILDIFTYREGQWRNDTTKAEERQISPIIKTLSAAKQIFTTYRRLKKPGLRAVVRQFRIKTGLINLYASDPSSISVFPQATVNGAANTAQLSGGTAWPTDITRSKIYFSFNYTKGYLILTVSGDTITLSDPDNTLPSGVVPWEIRGYTKDDHYVTLMGYDAIYFSLGTPNQAFEATDKGANPTVP